MNILIPLFIALYASFMLGWIISKERYRQQVSKIIERVQKNAAMNHNNVILGKPSPALLEQMKESGETENSFQYFLRKLAEEFDNI